MRNNQQNMAYSDLHKVCEHYVGNPRQTGSSPCGAQDPLAGRPARHIQNDKGKAKAYQVRQVIKAIDRKEAE